MITEIPLPIWIGLASLVAAALAAASINRVTGGGPRLQGRLGHVDGLRGLLALAVMLHHFAITYRFHLLGTWQASQVRFYRLNGHVGIALFFMITGFLFWHRILATRGRIEWGRFFVSRIFRLVPLYFAVVGAIVAVVFLRGGFHLRESPAKLCHDLWIWLTFRGGPDINVFPNTSRIVAGVTWSLTYEWAFYAVLPLVALAVRPTDGSRFLVPALAVVAAALAIANVKVPVLHLSAKFFQFFLAGGICAGLYGRPGLRAALSGKAAAILALSALLVLYGFLDEGFGFAQWALLTLFFMPIALGNPLFGLLALPSLVLLGEISYSIYLTHGIVLYTLYEWIFPGFFVPGRDFRLVLLAMPLTAIVVVALSWASFRLIESRGMEWGKRALGRSKRPGKAPYGPPRPDKLAAGLPKAEAAS